MAWMAVEKEYRFEGQTDRRAWRTCSRASRQLIVYRAFYAPDVTTYPASGGAYPEGPVSAAPSAPTRSHTRPT
jgi:predicted dithiol-disulfide oxidoreductase (DUF899 family)